MPHRQKESTTVITETTCPSDSETYKVIHSNNKYCELDSQYPSTVKKTLYGDGHMLVATRDLKEGELVAVFRGPIYELNEYNSSSSSSSSSSGCCCCKLTNYDKCYVLIYNTSTTSTTSTTETTETEYKLLLPISKARYLNHSCNPNCELKKSTTTTTTTTTRIKEEEEEEVEVEVYTTRRVEKGEELTFLYNYGEDKGVYNSNNKEGEGEWNVDLWDDLWSFECQCGYVKCQKRIDKYRQ
ncbi:hypothetical protein MP638_006389 [Amoeboaphelidium occidentale]|nr:hypothetical protein MP638_006389 [Amoeboaphelidium occidentale]